MVRKALASLGWGLVLVASALYIFEFIASDYETPQVSILKWSMLFLAGLLIFFARNKDEVFYHHLPH